VVRVDDSHTGEEILVAARGPGAESLRGFIPNTAIFHLMMDAYGWPQN
jgi:alkaline phosphatase